MGLPLESKCEFSHFFLSPAVNQWIKERVEHEKCAKPWIKGWHWRKKSGSYKRENKSPRQKAHQKCTDHKHSCLERFVLLRKSFQFFLRYLLSFDLLLVSKDFTVQNQVRKYNEKNAGNTDKSYCKVGYCFYCFVVYWPGYTRNERHDPKCDHCHLNTSLCDKTRITKSKFDCYQSVTSN